MSGKAGIFSGVLAVKPRWLMPKEAQCFSLKAKGAVQSRTVTSNSIGRGETAKKRTIAEACGILLRDINQA